MDPDSNNLTISLIIILCCLLFSAFFSATETAFSSLNRIKLKNKATSGNKKAKRALAIHEKYDSLLTTILIGNNLVNILASTISTILFVTLLGQATGSTVSTIVTTIIVLIFGEITPKTIAKEYPEKFAMFSAPIMGIMIIIFTPFNFIFSKWKLLIDKMFNGEDENDEIEEELLTIVEEAEENGNLQTQEKDLIQNAIEFGELEVGDIYTPRIDVTAIQKDTSYEEVFEMFKETAFSRIPVYNKDIDDIIGILNSKDFVSNKDKKIEEILQPAIFTTTFKKIHDLLIELQKAKLHMAIVVDEYGCTIGIITMEDMLEELVGEIWDEHDEVIIDIQEYKNGKYKVTGKCSLCDLIEKFNLEIESEHNTVSGWCCEMLNGIPNENDEFTYANYKFIIEKVNDKCIDEIIINNIQEE